MGLRPHGSRVVGGARGGGVVYGFLLVDGAAAAEGLYVGGAAIVLPVCVLCDIDNIEVCSINVLNVA